MRENVTTGEILFRKPLLQAIVYREKVGPDVIRIIGDEANLYAVIASAGSSAAPSLRCFASKWRAHGESNPGLIRERDLS